MSELREPPLAFIAHMPHALGIVTRLLEDESANAIVEYAVVLAALSIVSMVAFNAVAQTTTNAIASDANNLATNNMANFAP